MHYLVTAADSWVISCAATDSVWPCPYLLSATGCRASAFFSRFMQQLLTCLKGEISPFTAIIWACQGQHSGGAECEGWDLLRADGRRQQREAASPQAGIKNILRGLFFLKLKQRNTKSSFSWRSWFNGTSGFGVSLGWKRINWPTCRLGKAAWNDCIPAKQNKDGFPPWECKSRDKSMSGMISFRLFCSEERTDCGQHWFLSPTVNAVVINTSAGLVFCWDYLSCKLQNGSCKP